jgi:hypothetical protein
MDILSPFLSIDSACDRALQMTKTRLSQAGLTAVQTFNLHTARLAFHDCSCPNHGTAACDCQLIVLLVYGEVVEPATLILHGNAGKTWISIPDNTLHLIDAKLVADIRQALGNLVSRDT